MPIYPYSFTLPPVNKQDIPSDGVVGEFLGISAGGVLDWLPVSGGSGSGDLLAANNLSELTLTAGTARTNLGLGTGDSPTFANLTLTSPSLSTSAPVTISQTWNNAAVAFTGLKVNAAGTSGTNSAVTSLLLDLQVGGLRRFTVQKDGWVNIGASDVGSAVRMLDLTNQYGNVGFQVGGGGRLDIMNGGTTVVSLFSGGAMTLSGASAFIGIGSNVNIIRDADNTLALRNGAAAQTFNVYGTYTSITDYKRLSLSCSATTGNATIGVPFNSVLAVTGGSSPSTTATITFAAQAAAFPVGSSVVVAGVTPSGYNGTYVVTASTTSSVSYTVSGALAAWSSGGTATVSGSAALTLTGAGNVGIGTTAPSEKLEVAGNGKFTGTFPYVALKPSAWASDFFFQAGLNLAVNNFGDYTFFANPAAKGFNWTQNLVSRLFIDATTGNVGIGTTAPTSNLEVVSTSSALLTVRSATGAADGTYFVAQGQVESYYYLISKGNLTGSQVMRFGNANSSNFVIQALNDANTALSRTPVSISNAAPTGSLHILSSGNVGIGTTSPTSKLQVSAGDVEVDTIAKGVILKSPDGTRYRVTVANGGTLSVAAV